MREMLAAAQQRRAATAAAGSKSDRAAGAAEGGAATRRVGLCLSGGGFRATLYHLGVLARLADADALRHVEAISCVSGGAIVGAHYFLLLRNLLERKRDADITREDYIAVVAQTIDDITAFTSKSLIWRLLLDAPSDAAVTMRLGSRVPAAGKCIEAGLFARAVRGRVRRHDDPEGMRGKSAAETSGTRSCTLHGLLRRGRAARQRRCDDGPPLPVSLFHLRSLRTVLHGDAWHDEAERRPQLRDAHPARVTEAMLSDPQHCNARRRNKVPLLLVQATTLNTGHRFVFTSGGWMGELGKERTIHDTNVYLKPIAYQTLSMDLADRVSLGNAVAASACVPGVFDPLTLTGLYSGLELSLVDGGVADNLGLLSLVDCGCTFVHCSDGALGLPLERRCAGAHNFLASSFRSIDMIMLHQSVALIEEAKKVCDCVVHCSLAYDRRTTDLRAAVSVHRTMSVVAPKGALRRAGSDRLRYEPSVHPRSLASTHSFGNARLPLASVAEGSAARVQGGWPRQGGIDADATALSEPEVTVTIDANDSDYVSVSFFLEEDVRSLRPAFDDKGAGGSGHIAAEARIMPPPSLGRHFSSEALRSIRAIRTSLDVFSEAEAAALMCFSYCAMRTEMGAQERVLPQPPWDRARTLDAAPNIVATEALFSSHAYIDAYTDGAGAAAPSLSSADTTGGADGNKWGFLWLLPFLCYSPRRDADGGDDEGGDEAPASGMASRAFGRERRTRSGGLAEPMPGHISDDTMLPPHAGGLKHGASFLAAQVQGVYGDMLWAARRVAPWFIPCAPTFACMPYRVHQSGARRERNALAKALAVPTMRDSTLRSLAEVASKAIVPDELLEASGDGGLPPTTVRLRESETTRCTQRGFEAAAEELLRHLEVGDDPLFRIYRALPWYGRLVAGLFAFVVIGGIITAIVFAALNWYHYTFQDTIKRYNAIVYESNIASAAKLYFWILRDNNIYTNDVEGTTFYDGCDYRAMYSFETDSKEQALHIEDFILDLYLFRKDELGKTYDATFEVEQDDDGNWELIVTTSVYQQICNTMIGIYDIVNNTCGAPSNESSWLVPVTGRKSNITVGAVYNESCWTSINESSGAFLCEDLMENVQATQCAKWDEKTWSTGAIVVTTLLAAFVALFPAPPFLGWGLVLVVVPTQMIFAAVQLWLHDPWLRRRGRLEHVRRSMARTAQVELVATYRAYERSAAQAAKEAARRRESRD